MSYKITPSQVLNVISLGSRLKLHYMVTALEQSKWSKCLDGLLVMHFHFMKNFYTLRDLKAQFLKQPYARNISV